jgi:NAD(P)-dependent dehydrogenase (short-subunit alcohol dehydrogenase family)
MESSTQPASFPSLRDRLVLVTGGASGIGEAIVTAFSRQNARVVFLDLLEAEGKALASRLSNRSGPAPIFYSCDLTNIGASQETLTEILETHGPVDVLVNNAGNDTRHAFTEVSSETWDHLIAVNLKHQFFVTQAVVPSMREIGRGSIINMSSIAWIIPSTGLPVYVMAKAAIVGLTRTLAHELGADGIRVNCVMPGAIQTERQERLWLTETYKAEILSRQALKRMILPEEVAKLVLFLAADESSGITNQSYAVDGGWT